jgi:glycosyltransferase involved in cell wall biosynthesis
MKILLVSSRFLPHRGGLESVVNHLASEFQSLGHAVRIVTPRYPRNLPAEEKIDGIQVNRLHFILPNCRQLRNMKVHLWLAGWYFRIVTTHQLGKLMDDFQPDVVNNHYLNEVAELSGICLDRLDRRIPWVISLHGGDVDGEPCLSSQNRQRFTKWSRKADQLTACSGFLKEQALKLEPGLQEKLRVIHNGVDSEKFASAQPFVNNRPYILGVGQLYRHKGFDILIEAFAEIADQHPIVQLLIAGDGAERNALESLIQQKDLEGRVSLLGSVGENTVARLMAGCLFMTMTSRRESFGITALEGMAAGKSVLAVPVGGIPEFLLVPPNRMVEGEVEEWSQALDEWLGQALQGKLRAEGNHAAAMKHDWKILAQQYLEAYRQAGADG